MSVPASQDRDAADTVWADFAGGRVSQPASYRAPPEVSLLRRVLAILVLMIVGAAGCVGAVIALSPFAQHHRRPFILILTAVLGVFPGIVAYLLIRFPRSTKGRNSAQTGPPVAIIYSPLPPSPDAAVLELEARLLHLCKQDRLLFDRLVKYEQDHHPTASRQELLRQAIDHFDRDNV
jgi:hypothetical protein